MSLPARTLPSSRSMRSVLAVNAVLVALLGVVTFMPSSGAQGFRPKGQYHMVAGNAPGVPAGVVYVVDETTQQMLAISYDPNNKNISGRAYRDIAADIAAGGRSRN